MGAKLQLPSPLLFVAEEKQGSDGAVKSIAASAAAVPATNDAAAVRGASLTVLGGALSHLALGT